jgi:uncharacterized membrane protein/glutaredoxin
MLPHLLETLKINHTKAETKRLSERVVSMGSLSDALNHYRIGNMAVRLQPQQLERATFPCVAHCQEAGKPPYFVLLEGLANGQVAYNDGKTSHRVSVSAFANIWSGSLLLLAPDAQSVEPNYEANKRQERFENIQKAGIVAAIVLLLLPQKWLLDGYALHYCIKCLYALGIYVSVLLLQSEYGQTPIWVQKLCAIGNDSQSKIDGCSAVSRSSGGKILGWLSWSEIGLVYFLGGFLAMLFRQSYIAKWFAFVVLFFVPYSLYYQAFVAKQWCKLCLAVQGIFILLAVTWFFVGGVNAFSVADLYGFGLALVAWFVFKPVLVSSQEGRRSEAEAARFKTDSSIFKAFLAAQPHIDLLPLPHEDQIGNTDAPVVITMVSNPNCGSCQQAHTELSDCVAFFEDELQLRIRHINTGEDKYKSHEAFAEAVGVAYTPTIFINGHQLQQPYSFKDIRLHVRVLAEQQI